MKSTAATGSGDGWPSPLACADAADRQAEWNREYPGRQAEVDRLEGKVRDMDRAAAKATLAGLVRQFEGLLARLEWAAVESEALRRWQARAPLTAEHVAELMGMTVAGVYLAVARGRLVKRGCCRAGFWRADVERFAEWRAARGVAAAGRGVADAPAGDAPGARPAGVDGGFGAARDGDPGGVRGGVAAPAAGGVGGVVVGGAGVAGGSGGGGVPVEAGAWREERRG